MLVFVTTGWRITVNQNGAAANVAAGHPASKMVSTIVLLAIRRLLGSKTAP